MTAPRHARQRGDFDCCAAAITRQQTYDQAIETAARLYRGMRLAEMTLTGDLGMPRVTDPADRAAMSALVTELRESGAAFTRITRRGRHAFRGAR